MPPRVSPRYAPSRRIVFAVAALIVAAIFAATLTKSANTKQEVPQATTAALTQISLATNDIIYDPTRQTIYASVPSGAAGNADNVVRINPATGAIGPAVTSGSNPGRLALSGDGQFLYVGLDGANSIRRFDLQSSSTANEFSLGMGSFGRPNRAEDIEVLPGQPQSVAVALDDLGAHQGVAIYDNGVARPNRAPQIPQNNVLEFAGNAATLFGYNSANTEFGLHRYNVDANGLTHVTTVSNMIISNADIRFDNGLLFASNGVVFDPQTSTMVGSFQLPGFGYSVAPDAANNRVYFLSAANSDPFVSLWAFDLQTFLPVGKVALPGLTGQPSRLIRCGPNVFAARTSDNQVFLIELSSIQPIAPTPLPSPTLGADAVVKLQLAVNDLIFDPGTQKVYASVPGNIAGIGNSIVPIDPNTGSPSAPIRVGSNPNRLAVSDNSQFLYAGLDGAGGVRRFDLQSQAAGPQFSLGFNPTAGQLTAIDIEVQPGNASVIAVSLKNRNFLPSYDGVAVYDNGVRRANRINSNIGGPAIEFGASSSVLYNMGGFAEFNKYTVDGSGLSVANSARNVIIGGEFVFDDGKVYSASGQAADAETATLLGSFAISGFVASNAAANRIYYITWDGSTAIVFGFEISTFRPVSFLTIPNIVGVPRSLIRWGTDGLAFHTSGGQVVFFHTPSMQPYPSDNPTFTTRPDGVRKFSLAANDIVYNPVDQLIYATVPSASGGIGNSIAAVNPTTGLVGQPVFVGSDPYKLGLSDDGKTIYTTLLGVPLVRKYDITTKTPGIQFGLGSDSVHGRFYGENLAVAPGNPNMVAVTCYLPDVLGGAGVVLTNNGVVLPGSTFGESLVFSGSHLYTYTNETTEFGLRKLAVNSTTGLSELNFVTNLVNGFGQRIAVAGGRIFGSDGAVADANSVTLLGKFRRSDPGVWVAPDVANNRVYFLGLHDFVQTSLVLTSYDATTFLQVGSVTLQNIVTANEVPRTFIRYGADGLAFTTSEGEIVFLNTSMLAPISATPIPTPVQVTPEIKQIPLTTGGLVYNSADGMIYASVPSRTDGFGNPITFGNSIVPINPATGTLGQPVHVGSEPKKLIITPNGQHIYAALDGAGSVARVDMATKTVGLKFSLGNDAPSRGPRFVEDMQVSPGSVSTLAISRLHKNGTPRHTGVAIYDNGVQRPNTTSAEFPSHFDNNNAIEYSSSPSTIYGYSLESTIQHFHKLTVNASGVQVATTVQNPFNVGDFVFDSGLLYANGGQVINPETATIVGSFSGLSTGNQFVIPESSTDRIYFLDDNLFGTVTIRVYRQSTRALIGTMAVPNVRGFPSSFIRWGTNGLAFKVTSDILALSSQVYLITLPPALTPPPTPTGPIELLLDSTGPAADQVASLDSVLQVRDPFPVINPANVWSPSNDRNTRVVIFARNLQLAQGETASSVVVNLVDAASANHDIAAEDVRAVPNTDFVQVIFRLPNNLAVGTCSVKIKAQTRTSNTGTMRIRS